MKSKSYDQRMNEAILYGVINRLEINQAYFAVKLLSKCIVPREVFESKRVRELSLMYLRGSFDRCYTHLAGDDLEMAAKLVKAVKVPESEVKRVILEHASKYIADYKRLPRNIEDILEVFPIPFDDLNRNPKYRNAAIAEINSESELGNYKRQLCLLKNFSLPMDAINTMVKTSLYFYDSSDEKGNQFDEFIKATGLNRGKILFLMTSVISELIGDGDIDTVQMLIEKFSLPNNFIINENNRMLAIDGALDQFNIGQVDNARRIIKLFGLSKADFDEGILIKSIESCIDRSNFDSIEDIIAFAEIPNETITTLIRGNLPKLVPMETTKLRHLTEKYGIVWDEVIGVVEDYVVNGLAKSGSKYLLGYIEGYGLPKEFMTSDRVIEAAKEGLIKVYENADVNNDIDFLTRIINVS